VQLYNTKKFRVVQKQEINTDIESCVFTDRYQLICLRFYCMYIARFALTLSRLLWSCKHGERNCVCWRWCPEYLVRTMGRRRYRKVEIASDNSTDLWGLRKSSPFGVHNTFLYLLFHWPNDYIQLSASTEERGKHQHHTIGLEKNRTTGRPPAKWYRLAHSLCAFTLWVKLKACRSPTEGMLPTASSAPVVKERLSSWHC
jgi:hypothetical protein